MVDRFLSLVDYSLPSMFNGGEWVASLVLAGLAMWIVLWQFQQLKRMLDNWQPNFPWIERFTWIGRDAVIIAEVTIKRDTVAL